MTPEGRLKAQCRKLANTCNLPFWNIEGKGTNGVPDTLCGKYPLGSGVILIEFKRPGQRPNPQQERRIQELQRAGLAAGWADSFERYCELIGYESDL